MPLPLQSPREINTSTHPVTTYGRKYNRDGQNCAGEPGKHPEARGLPRQSGFRKGFTKEILGFKG